MQSSYTRGTLVHHIVSDGIERLKDWRKRNETSPSPSHSLSHGSVLFLLMKLSHMTSMSSIYLSSILLTISEISSDDSQDQISIEQYESDNQRSCTKDRFRGTGAGTVLELNSTTISQFLRPFKSQLADISHLVEFSELAPYITTPASGQSPSRDSPSTNSSNNSDEDDSPPPEKRRRVDRSAKVQYPPTQAQSRTLDQFRAAHTLIFTSLPSADWVIKLIAISVQISEPFYGKVLFPNVKRVVFSSAMQEKSLVDRYAHLGSFTLPHPITFALDWLVYGFSLCIHSTTLAFRTQWIDSRVKIDKSERSLEEKVEMYERKWWTLNPLAGTVSTENFHRFQSISYHNILPGDRLHFSGNIKTYLYFGRHDISNQRAVDITLRSIAKPLAQTINDPQAPIPVGLHTIDIEYLGSPNLRKLGPKAIAQQLIHREAGLKRLLIHVKVLCEADGGMLIPAAVNNIWAMLRSGSNEQFCDPVCQVCGDMCDEVSCSEFTILLQRDALTRQIRIKRTCSPDM